VTERLSIPEPPGARGGPYAPPPVGGEPRLYALLAVEIRPGAIAYYHLELDHTPGACTIDMDRPEPEVIYPADALSSIRLAGTAHISATISGTVVSNRPDYPPPTRTPASVDENALTGDPRELPGRPS